MKATISTRWLRDAALTIAVLHSTGIAQAQGTITFNGATGFAGTSYTESGVRFQVITPTAGPHDYMGIGPAITGPSNVPYNNTPYMIFNRFYSPNNYVSLSLLSAGNFGLTSVQLADPSSPSLSPVSISFIGYLASGSTVTNTYTTPGNGATTFATFIFGPDLSSGLTSVDILAPRWAMDNLVFTVPEPSTFALFGLAAAALGAHRFNRRRKL